MKKLLSIIVMGCAAITVSAQYQLQNSGFEEWETVKYAAKNRSGEEPVHWSSFLTGNGSGFVMNQAAFSQVSKSTNEKHSGNACALVTGRSAFMSIVAQGNLTTGRINIGSTTASDANANYNYTETADSDFNQKFEGKPDFFSVWIKFQSSNTQYKGKISAILHTDGYYQDPIGNKGKVTAQLVAEANNIDIVETGKWEEIRIPLNYNDATLTPSYALVSFSTSHIPGKGDANAKMFIDDVKFIYNSSLSDLKVNGKTINGFNKEVYSYEVDDVYTEGCLSAIKDCVGGTCEIAVNGQVATITVKGDDFEKNPSNKHVYTVKFANPSVTINTDFTAGFVTGLQDFYLSRNFPAGWNTICLPFATKTSDFGAGVKAQAFSSANENGLNFTTVTNLEAHKPYLIYFPNGFSKTLKYTANVTSTTPVAVNKGDWSFLGTYTGLVAGEMTGFYGVMKNEQGGQSIRKAGVGASIKGTRAYFQYNGSANVNSIKLNLEGETTGIDCIENGKLTVSLFPANIYGIDGRMVKANAKDLYGLSKGIYVVNGKKIIVK